MTFTAGKTVVCPSQGLGNIENISTSFFSQKSEKFHLLRLICSCMTLMVPFATAQTIGHQHRKDSDPKPSSDCVSSGFMAWRFRLLSFRKPGSRVLSVSRSLVVICSCLFSIVPPPLTAQTQWQSVTPQEGANVSVPANLHFTVAGQANDATLTMIFSTQKAVYPNDENVAVDCLSVAGAVLGTVVPARHFTGERNAAPAAFTWDVPLACLRASPAIFRVLLDPGAAVTIQNAWLNYRTGTLPLLADTALIEGYANRISVHPGEAIEFKISVAQPENISIDFLRLGTDNVVMSVPGPIPAISQPYSLDAYKQGANWRTTYTLQVPAA
jgi:hypothetical protein